MASNRNRIYKRRKTLWEENNRCVWCNIETLLLKKSIMIGKKHLYVATLDHLYSKYNDKRTTPNVTNEERIVIACYRCNNDRQAFETVMMPIKELRARGCRMPRTTKLFPKGGFVFTLIQFIDIMPNIFNNLINGKPILDTRVFKWIKYLPECINRYSLKFLMNLFIFSYKDLTTKKRHNIMKDNYGKNKEQIDQQHIHCTLQ